MNTAVLFDPTMMRRYDREGPRYTSYPTALQFRDGLAPEVYDAAARASPGARLRDPLSIYVHVPFCTSPCFYCGCNKIVTRQRHRAEVYLADLVAEISLRSRHFDRAREVEQLHFGGGTPTFLTPDQLEDLLGVLGRHCRLSDSPGRDYSIEIDPRTVDAGYLERLWGLGFNRLSLGVQDFDPAVQQAVNRVQSPALVAEVVAVARGLGFASINFDLIYGLPRQTPQSYARTLEQVLELKPDRLAIYGYAHLPQLFKGQRQILAGELPDAGQRLALLQSSIATLTDAGYVYIGMDHFARPDDPLAEAQRTGTLHRSFQGYTTHASRDLVSFGVSAIGQVGDLYVQNHKRLEDYSDALARGVLPSQRGVTLTADDRVRRDVIQQIMCQGRIEPAAIGRRHGLAFDTYFAAEIGRLEPLIDDGLVAPAGEDYVLTGTGRLLMRHVAMAFDGYLKRTPIEASPRLSRVI